MTETPYLNWIVEPRKMSEGARSESWMTCVTLADNLLAHARNGDPSIHTEPRGRVLAAVHEAMTNPGHMRVRPELYDPGAPLEFEDLEFRPIR